MGKNRYTKKQIKFLRTGYAAMGIPDLTRLFNRKFGKKKTRVAIKAALSNRKITCGRTTGNLNKGTSRILTPPQINFVKTNYPLFSQIELTARFNKNFGTKITEQQIRSFTRNHRIRSGRTGRFEKGQKSWNKGTKGLTHGSCTSFKKGHVPANLKPLGHERKDNRTDPTKGNYHHVKVAERNPYTGFPTRYRLKHVVVWEKEYGPVPVGKILVFKDGDVDNCKIENLMLVNRAEHLRLNHYHYKKMPADLKPSVLALAKLEVKTFGLMKNNTGFRIKSGMTT